MAMPFGGGLVMTQINPLTGSLIQSTQVQPRQSADKERQIRRLQNLSKNTALQGDRLEHQVESSDSLHALNDQGNGQQQRRQQHTHPKKCKADQQDEESHIDLTA